MEENCTLLINIFLSAMDEVESLHEFFNRSNRTLVEYKIGTERDFGVGKQVADLFDECMEATEGEEREQKLKHILSQPITPDLSLENLFEVVPFFASNDYIRFVLKKKYRDQKGYYPSLARKQYERVDRFEYILIESVLSHIIVTFENYFSDIYRYLLTTKPLQYFGEQTILLADVIKTGIDDVIDEKIGTEVDDKMRNSLATLKKVEQKEEIKIDRYEKIVDAFVELYYRRNAYVHTSGRANKDYLKNVLSKYIKDVNEDDLLVCDGPYIENAMLTLEKLIFSISYELLLKIQAPEECIDVIANYYFNRLKAKEYQIAQFAYYALSQFKGIQFANRAMYRINYINAAKQLGETKLVEKELKDLDISIATDNFQIAKECLANNNKTVFEMLEKTYPDSFDAVCIREWPIFINFRETEFYEQFVSAHEDDFSVQEIEAD